MTAQTKSNSKSKSKSKPALKLAPTRNGKPPAKSWPNSDNAKTEKIRQALMRSAGRKPAPEQPAEPVAVGMGREGKRSIAIYMTPLAKEVLDAIARKHKRSVQQLGIEALNLLFLEYDEKPVA